jgi:hypothetical protein
LEPKDGVPRAVPVEPLKLALRSDVRAAGASDRDEPEPLLHEARSPPQLVIRATSAPSLAASRLKPSLVRLSSAIGVESVRAADHTFELLVDFGTETFENALEVNSFRLVFGTNRGF